MKILFVVFILTAATACRTSHDSAAEKAVGQGKVLWNCTVQNVDQNILSEFKNGQPLTLYAFSPALDQPQPEAFVRIVKSPQGQLTLNFGGRSFKTSAPDVSNNVTTYAATSGSSANYLLKINSFNNKSDTLSGYSSQAGEQRARQFATLDCSLSG